MNDDLRPSVATIVAGHSLHAELVAAIEDLEARMHDVAAELGRPSPALSIVTDAALPARAFRLRVLGDTSDAPPIDGLDVGAVLVRNTPLFVRAQLEATGMPDPDVRPWPDPLVPTRTAAVVHDVVPDQVRARFGDDALTAADHVGRVAMRWLRSALVSRIDALDAAQVVARLPTDDAAALLRACPIDDVAAVLDALMHDRLPLTEFASIAPLLADEGRVAWVAVGLATVAYPGRLLIAAPRPTTAPERRYVVARAVTVPSVLRRRAQSEPLQVWVLDEVAGWLPSAQATADDLAHFEAALATRAAAASADGAILITSPARRAPVAAALRVVEPDLLVVSTHELPPGVPLQRRGGIRIAPPKPPARTAP